MADPKTLTEKAMRYKREAYIERACKDPPVLAPMWEREAAELLALPGPPDVGPGGEVVREQTRGLGYKRANIRDTLAQGADRTAEDASIQRTDLLMQSNMDCVALGIDTAASIDAANSIEKMLAHQMAAAHEASMRFLNNSLNYNVTGRRLEAGESVEACRMANTAARLMSVFQAAALTLQRLRTGGSQTVTVQHVNVAPGGQAAVVGNMQTGGPNYAGGKGK